MVTADGIVPARDGLPPGQFALDAFPRFGLLRYAARLPKHAEPIQVTVQGEVGEALTVTQEEIRALPRVEQTSDFHCVSTWSRRSLRWGGVRFADFYARVVVPRARPHPDVAFVLLRCRDGYQSSLPLADLLAGTVLLADTLDGVPLPVEHGAPLRLVAPAHYGYKNVKHLTGIELWREEKPYRSAAFRFMLHPRARVALEERGTGVPGWVLRYLYRPLVGPTIRWFGRYERPL